MRCEGIRLACFLCLNQMCFGRTLHFSAFSPFQLMSVCTASAGVSLTGLALLPVAAVLFLLIALDEAVEVVLFVSRRMRKL